MCLSAPGAWGCHAVRRFPTQLRNHAILRFGARHANHERGWAADEARTRAKLRPCNCSLNVLVTVHGFGLSRLSHAASFRRAVLFGNVNHL